MANEALERAGMYFDDLNRSRGVDEETPSQVDIFRSHTHSLLSLSLSLSLLERAGMYFDDLNRVRVLDEETSSQV